MACGSTEEGYLSLKSNFDTFTQPQMEAFFDVILAALHKNSHAMTMMANSAEMASFCEQKKRPKLSIQQSLAFEWRLESHFYLTENDCYIA